MVVEREPEIGGLAHVFDRLGPARERIFIELITSDRKLKASRQGSKGRIYGT